MAAARWPRWPPAREPWPALALLAAGKVARQDSVPCRPCRPCPGRMTDGQRSRGPHNSITERSVPICGDRRRAAAVRWRPGPAQPSRSVGNERNGRGDSDRPHAALTAWCWGRARSTGQRAHSTPRMPCSCSYELPSEILVSVGKSAVLHLNREWQK